MSSVFSFKIGSSVFIVDEPDSNPDNWLITKDESYRPDKQKFIEQKFRKDYPGIKVKDANQVYALASRSAKLNDWLAKANLEYAVVEGAPTYFRDYVDPKDFEQASKEVQKLSQANSDKAKAQAYAATEYKNKLAEIDKEFEKKLSTSDNIAKIISLNSTALPLSIQLAIDNYTPASSSSPNQRAYSRECLINYKIKLLEALTKDKKLNIDKLITENMEK